MHHSPTRLVNAVRARERVDLESVAPGVGVEDPNRRRKAARLNATGVPGDCDCVVAVGPVDNDTVAAPVSCATTDGASEVDIHARHVGSCEVVDGDRIGAAEGVEVDPLDACGVHRDRCLSAEEPEPVAVRGQVDLLGAACAVEEHRVGPGLALDDVAAVARIPDEGVVAGTHEGDVVATVSVDGVVPVATEQQLCPEPPARLSAPAPPSIVVGSVSEGPVAFVDADEVVAVSGIELDSCDVLAGEVVVRRAVVADIELRERRVAGLQAKREPVTPLRALDREQSSLSFGCLMGITSGAAASACPATTPAARRQRPSWPLPQAPAARTFTDRTSLRMMFFMALPFR